MTVSRLYDIVIDGSGPHLDRFFTYRGPLDGSRLQPGQYVMVPWGEKFRGGVVVDERANPPEGLSLEDIRHVERLTDPRIVVDSLRLKMAAWLREFYFAPWGTVVSSLVPGPVLQSLRKGTKSRKKKWEFAEGEDRESLDLTSEQLEVWAQLQPELISGRTFLLHGVTGSGKTELYLRAAQEVLSQGKQVLVLVPEVSLTPQAQERYRGRFGAERVSILHSGLKPAERRFHWWNIAENRVDVVVGTRSAIFSPLANCGLIVIDEEHDGSYKQNSELRYHARQVAAWLSRETGATLILGSATPSLESYSLARQGRYGLLEMFQRVHQRPLPPLEIIKGRGLPPAALNALRDCKKRGEQSVVLLNRRGFSRYLICHDCGAVPECPNCSISLTYHQKARALRCHYCGSQCRAPDRCAGCGGGRLEFPGRGTERLEQELVSRIPGLRVARLDRDTVGGRSSVFEQTFESFSRLEFDCLLGTQMVAKGLDFPQVTLVVVLEADTGLHLPDFRAAERTFSLLTQVAGRTGRSETQGRVILVSRQPDHPLFEQLRGYRWADFMAQEMEIRRALSYPPHRRMVRFLLSDTSEERVEKTSLQLADQLQESVGLCESSAEILGPAPCPLEKLQSRYRWHILLRAPGVQDLQAVVRKTLQTFRPRSTRVAIDTDPLELL